MLQREPHQTPQAIAGIEAAKLLNVAAFNVERVAMAAAKDASTTALGADTEIDFASARKQLRAPAALLAAALRASRIYCVLSDDARTRVAAWLARIANEQLREHFLREMPLHAAVVATTQAIAGDRVNVPLRISQLVTAAAGIGSIALESDDFSWRVRAERPMLVSIPNDVAAMPVDDLAINVRTIHLLKTAGITTVAGLAEFSRRDIVQIKNLRRKDVLELEQALTSVGLPLKD